MKNRFSSQILSKGAYDMEFKLEEVKFRGSKLTEKQIAVLELVAEGMTNLEISESLFLSIRTVESHLLRIRNIIGEHMPEGKKISDRKLVLFARDFIEGMLTYKNIRKKEMQSHFLWSGNRKYA